MSTKEMTALEKNIDRLWAANGVACCAEAQADGVPCEDVGRKCEQCEEAARFLRDIKEGERQADERPVPTDIGA